MTVIMLRVVFSINSDLIKLNAKSFVKVSSFDNAGDPGVGM